MPTCPIHNKEMGQRSGENGPWWSCATKVGGAWCPWRSQDGETVYRAKAKFTVPPSTQPQAAADRAVTADVDYVRSASYPVAPPRTPEDRPGTKPEQKVDWEAKDRLMAAMGAYKTASTIYQGQGIEAEAHMFQLMAMIYKITMGCKVGGEIEELIRIIGHVKPREPEAF